MNVLEGEAFYRERIALPPGAQLTVVLEDVSRMDVPAIVLAEYRASAESAPPYAFELEYDPSAIDERMRYNVRASIREGDRLRFTSTSSTDPFRLAAGEPLRILMSMTAGGAGSDGRVEPDRDMRMVVSRNPLADLEGTRWRLASLDGVEVAQPEDSGREAYLVLDADTNTVGGSGSCNNFTGSFTAEGNTLAFGPIAATRKMCQDLMDLEQGLLDALGKTAWFSINGKTLVLLGGDKKPLAAFTAVE